MRKSLIGIFIGAFVGLLAACSSRDSSEVVKPVREFYEAYLNADRLNKPGIPDPTLPFSNYFRREIQESEDICRKYAEGPCGFGADIDPYILSQEIEDVRSAQEASLEVHDLGHGLIQVSFNLWPSSAISVTTIKFKMIEENGMWVVDDMIYPHERSVRDELRREREDNIRNAKTAGAIKNK